MYISPEIASGLRTRIAELSESQRAVLTGQWKEQKLPKLENLSDDQAEIINTLIDKLDMFQSNLDATQEEAF